jgi:hypothetical protein
MVVLLSLLFVICCCCAIWRTMGTQDSVLNCKDRLGLCLSVGIVTTAVMSSIGSLVYLILMGGIALPTEAELSRLPVAASLSASFIGMLEMATFLTVAIVRSEKRKGSANL